MHNSKSFSDIYRGKIITWVNFRGEHQRGIVVKYGHVNCPVDYFTVIELETGELWSVPIRDFVDYEI